MEALLKEKDQALTNDLSSRTGSTDSPFDSDALFLGLGNDYFDLNDTAMSVDPLGTLSSTTPLDDFAGIAAFMGTSAPVGYTAHDRFSGMDMVNPSWPRNLPDLPTLRHL